MEPNGFNITGNLCLFVSLFVWKKKKLYGGFFTLQIMDLADLDGIKISDNSTIRDPQVILVLCE